MQAASVYLVYVFSFTLLNVCTLVSVFFYAAPFFVSSHKAAAKNA